MPLSKYLRYLSQILTLSKGNGGLNVDMLENLRLGRTGSPVFIETSLYISPGFTNVSFVYITLTPVCWYINRDHFDAVVCGRSFLGLVPLMYGKTTKPLFCRFALFLEQPFFCR